MGGIKTFWYDHGNLRANYNIKEACDQNFKLIEIEVWLMESINMIKKNNNDFTIWREKLIRRK